MSGVVWACSEAGIGAAAHAFAERLATSAIVEAEVRSEPIGGGSDEMKRLTPFVSLTPFACGGKGSQVARWSLSGSWMAIQRPGCSNARNPNGS